MSVITINSTEHTALVEQADENRDQRYYVWALDSYLTDDYVAAVRNGERVIVKRFTEDEAWEWVENNRDVLNMLRDAQVNRDSYRQAYESQRDERSEHRRQYVELRNELTAVRTAYERALVVVASKGRDYARDNELCENYERFLMLGVNREATRISDPWLLDNYGSEVHGEDSLVGETYRSIMREFVRYGTRTRKAIVMVGHKFSAYVTRNDAGSAVLGAEIPNYYGDEHRTIVENAGADVMTYEECVKANEYAIRNGWSYAANAFGSSQDDEEC